MKFRVAFVCILFITKLCLVAPYGIDRKLFKDGNEITSEGVSTADDLKSSIEKNIKNLDIIILEDSNIKLDKTISIVTNDTTITGKLNSKNEKPIITCKNNNGYILILGNNITISNIEMRNCKNGPVIRIASNEDIVENGDDFKTVKLSNLDFKSNSEIEKNYDYKGGALFIGEGNSVTITNSSFKDNSAEQGAGIYWQLPSELRIQNSEFDSNVAEIAGGALYTEPSIKYGSYLEIENCNFMNNGYKKLNEPGGRGCTDTHNMPIESVQVYDFTDLCPTKGGGALFLEDVNEVIIKYSNFEKNYGTNAAGAIFLRDVDDIYMRFCNFTSNSLISSGTGVVSYGGAFYVLSLDSSSLFSLQHSTFFNNSAVYGGAFHFLATQGKDYFIENTDFNENNARASGGAIVVRNKNIDFSGNRFNKNKAFIGGAMIFANGARGKFHRGIDENINHVNSIFSENSAVDGGAIAAIGSSSLSIIETSMEKNAAGREGGAIYILETSINSNIDVRRNIFDDNIAVKGGAFYGQAVTNLEMDENCIFTNNKAVSGGAIYLTAINSFKNEIILNDIIFENNLVQTSYEDLLFPDTVKDFLNLTTATPNRTEFQNSPILLSEDSDDPCYPGGGGALCLKTIHAPDTAILHITLSNLIFQNNSGYVGGAAMLVTKDKNRDICRVEDCHYFTLDESEFYGNVVNGAGGAIFAFYPEYIQDTNREYNLTEKNKLSLKFENNSLIEGGYGKDVATRIANLKIMDTDLEFLEREYISQYTFELDIGIYDLYDQHIVNGIEYAEQLVRVRSSNSTIYGKLDAKAIKGISNFMISFDPSHQQIPLVFYVGDYDIVYNITISFHNCYDKNYRIKKSDCLSVKSNK